MPNKVLFLDFDGVLHPTHSGSPTFTQLPLLESVLIEQPCQIVISSSWRFHMSLEKLQGHLSKLQDHVIGITGEPHIGSYARFQEIKAYINQHDVLDWRALDDSYWEFPKNCENLIRCNPNTGVTQTELNHLRSWLERSYG